MSRGWRPAHVEKNLKLAKQLAEKDKAAGKVTCNTCAHVYDPAAGDPTQDVKAGTAFDALPNAWKCPACATGKNKFRKN